MSVETGFPDDLESIGTWLAARRWYGDKSRTLDSAASSLLGKVQLDDTEVRLCVLDLTFSDGGEATYFAPIVAPDEGGDLMDALVDSSFSAWLGNGFAEERVLDLEDGASLIWRRSSGEPTPWWERSPAPLAGEQSNTSIRFEDDAVIKVFRKWQPGINPDTEIVEFLTEETSFAQVPGFLGGIRLEREGGVIEVAAVQSFVENDGDCWMWLPPTLATMAASDLPELVDAVGLLGQRTGELHAALASGDDEAFEPEPLTIADVLATRQRIALEVTITIRMLVESGTISTAEGEELEAALIERLGNAASLAGTARTRVHGDYHLGQVLRSLNDFVIIDFEGEPSRSMTERREKQSPLKDVAGMVRSLDYAAASAAQGADSDRLEFLREAGAPLAVAFLDGYAAGVADAPDWILPTEAEGFAAALDLFMIEKALYETRYELDNRPDWIDIPFGALKRIAGS